MASLSDSLDSFFGIADEQSTCVDAGTRRRKLRHDVWSSNDTAWAQGLVERYKAIALPLLQSVSEVGDDDYPSAGIEQPARIPKFIHFIWLGSQPIPRHFKSEMDGNDAAETIKDIHMQDTEGWNADRKSVV